MDSVFWVIIYPTNPILGHVVCRKSSSLHLKIHDDSFAVFAKSCTRIIATLAKICCTGSSYEQQLQINVMLRDSAYFSFLFSTPDNYAIALCMSR